MLLLDAWIVIVLKNEANMILLVHQFSLVVQKINDLKWKMDGSPDFHAKIIDPKCPLQPPLKPFPLRL